jgi:hypothetical protein
VSVQRTEHAERLTNNAAALEFITQISSHGVYVTGEVSDLPISPEALCIGDRPDSRRSQRAIGGSSAHLPGDRRTDDETDLSPPTVRRHG